MSFWRFNMFKILTSRGKGTTGLFCCFVFCVFFVFSCGSFDDPVPSSETGSVTFTVEWQRPSDPSASLIHYKEESGSLEDCEEAGVDEVKADVYDGSDNWLTSDGPWDCDDHGAIIYHIPTGLNRKIVITGNDSDGSILYQGEATGITIAAGEITNVGKILLYPVGDPIELVNQAMEFLQKQDIAGANDKFRAAYHINPTNKDANFGLAITDIILLIENPNVIGFFDKYETYKPTIENIIYGLLNNTYEVWGGDSPICDRDEILNPDSHGYTKLIDTDSPVSPFSNESYQYYMIYALPFSEIDVTINGPGISVYCSRNSRITTWGDDIITTTIGDDYTFFGASMTIYAPNGMTLSEQGVQQEESLVRLIRRRILSSEVEKDEESTIVSEFKSLLNKLPKNRISPRKRMKILAKSLAEVPPSPSDVQKLIDNDILPVIDSAIPKLRVVEGKGYEFTITPCMTGGAEEVNTILDDGEFYTLDAILSVLKSALNILTAYNFDFNPDIILYDPISQINNTSFFTLKTNGKTKMTNALTALQDAADKAELAYKFIFNEWGYSLKEWTDKYNEPCEIYEYTDPKDNGLDLHGSYDPNRCCESGGLYNFTRRDDKDFRDSFDVVQLGLKGQVTYIKEVVSGEMKRSITDGTTTIEIRSKWVNDSDYTKSTRFDTRKFFTNPLDMNYLPTFDYDVPIDKTLSQIVGEAIHKDVSPGFDNVVGTDDDYVYCGIYQISTWPDMTFNGILPDGPPDWDDWIYLDNTKTLLMPIDVLWGRQEDIEVKGDGSFSLLKWDHDSNDFKIFTIDPNNGSIIGTVDIVYDPSELPNLVNWIEGHTYPGTPSIWASGAYYDELSNWYFGVFMMNINGTNARASNAIPLIIFNNEHIGDLASDGENLYLGIAYNDTFGNRKSGIIMFDPNKTLEISESTINESTPIIFDTSGDKYWAPKKFTVGGDFLWFYNDGIQKIDKSNGNIINTYAGDWEWDAAGSYYNGNLVKVDGQKILFFVIP